MANIMARRGDPELVWRETPACTNAPDALSTASQAPCVPLEHRTKIRQLVEWHEELKDDSASPGNEAMKPEKRR
jgi:hypothetical protein